MMTMRNVCFAYFLVWCYSTLSSVAGNGQGCKSGVVCIQDSTYIPASRSCLQGIVCTNVSSEAIPKGYYTVKCVNCNVNFSMPLYVFSWLRHLEIVNSSLNSIGLFNQTNRLVTINLSSNNISSVQPHAFDGLRQLMNLNLSSNSIAKIRLDSLAIYSRLKILDLSFNLIKTVALPNSVENLYLSHNELVIDNRTFSSLYNLTYLDISYNQLADIPEHAFQDLTMLRTLDVSCNRLVSFDYGSFAGLLEVASLNLSFNSINSIPEYVLHDIGNVQQLYLNNNNLSEFNSEAISPNLPKLRTISVHGNLWSCKTLSNVIRSLSKKGTVVTLGNCQKPPNIRKICCFEDDDKPIFSDQSNDTKSILQTLNEFFNKDFANSKFYNFFARDYREQQFWRYFDADFRQTNLFRFFDSEFLQSQFYRFFNRDYFNATFQNKIVDKIDSISPGENSVNISELEQTLERMFGKLFHMLNSSNTIQTLSESAPVVQSEYSHKDVLIGVMATVIVLIVLYCIVKNCGEKNSRFEKLKFYQMFRSKSSTANETDIEIL